ncbi:MAG TPA: hypothetical protein PLH91_12255 [Tenuifilaceae bacterium]|nr:hypothetical protein [Tenuifilaceae bacterium]HOZ14582.1 hypothetical protein [Tenuifilaceae bacterium]HPI45999.1 hypothetical protein [Tenuifilaceae bacterium]HPN20788.1 hypothetical protein [Tenuifilaceae bacterium]HPV57026.1 hypothetical protein [Tenuifilaceae bacterium]
MKTRVLFTLIILLPLVTFSQQKKEYKKDNISIFAGIGVSELVNSGIEEYYRQNLNPMLQTVCSHELDFNGINHTFMAELDMKVMSSDFKFDDLHEGIVSQGTMGLNFLFNIKNKTKNTPFDIFIGPGIYTVLSQKRIPKNPVAGVAEINDDYCSYSGLSINSSVSYSIPIDNNNVGAALRFFYHPEITFLNRNNTPEFNSMGVLVAVFLRFN